MGQLRMSHWRIGDRSTLNEAIPKSWKGALVVIGLTGCYLVFLNERATDKKRGRR